MLSRYEVVPAFSFDTPQVRVRFGPPLPVLHAVGMAEPGILLVGRQTQWASPLCRVIEESGAEPIIVSPVAITYETVKKNGHALVLLGPSVQSKQRRHLVNHLLGSYVSLFYAYPVERGCWWLPALLYGENHHGDASFRATEFLLELKRILQEISRRAFSVGM